MKTLLSILVALALLFAFSLPAMANDALTTEALADLSQENISGSVYGTGDAGTGDAATTGFSQDIHMSGINHSFEGIANANLNTGVMNNQAIQNTIAASTINNGISVVADAALSQINTSGSVLAGGTGTVTTGGGSGTIHIHGINKHFTGIANANLNTGALNNQAIQNTFAISAAVEVDTP
jgi:lysine/ornithine N-monooxygenase